MTELELDLAVNPVPLARPRVVNGRAFTPARSRAFAEMFLWELRAAGLAMPAANPARRTVLGLDPIADPIWLRLEFWRRTRNGNCGDIDNLAKAVLDAGNRTLWADDRQILRLDLEIVEHGSKVEGRIALRLEYPYARAEGGPDFPDAAPSMRAASAKS